MEVKEAVRKISNKFRYKADKKFITDFWFVMKEKDGKLEGDCDDFTISVLWEICDRSFMKFMWYVLILHKYRVYHVETYTGGKHAVGYANGLWFDNWTRAAYDEKTFFQRTRHVKKFMMISPVIIFFMLCGLTQR